MAENTKTLIRWLIDQIDRKAYRAGKASGKRHPDVDRELLETVGGLKSLVTQARELEQDVCLGGSIWGNRRKNQSLVQDFSKM